jgi:WD40 repeat protein
MLAPRLGDAIDNILLQDTLVIARLADGTAHCLTNQLRVNNSGVAELSKRVPKSDCLFWHGPTQSIALTARANYVDFYNPATRKTVLSLEVNESNIVRGERIKEATAKQELPHFGLSPSGKTLATVHDGNALKIWDFSASGDKFFLDSFVVEAHEEGVDQLDVAADGVVVTSSRGGERSVRIWRKTEAANWFLQNLIEYKRRSPDCFAVSPDLSALAVAHGSVVTLWDLEENRLRSVFSTGQDKEVEGGYNSLSFGNAGCSHLFFCSNRDSVRAWNLITCQMVWTIRMDKPSLRRLSDDAIYVTAQGGGVHGFTRSGGLEKMSEKAVKNLVVDHRGNYHYVLSDNKLEHSLPLEQITQEIATDKKDLLSVSRIARATPTTALRSHAPTSALETLVHKPVSLNLCKLLRESL